MGIDNGYLLVCIGVVLVVLFNVGLIFSLTSPATREQLRIFSKLARSSRNPWKKHDDDFSELRDRVAGLESNQGEVDEPNH